MLLLCFVPYTLCVSSTEVGMIDNPEGPEGPDGPVAAKATALVCCADDGIVLVPRPAGVAVSRTPLAGCNVVCKTRANLNTTAANAAIPVA